MDYYKKTFTQRYINKQLPLNNEKYTRSANKNCPCCKKEENAAHFLTCSQNIEQWSSLVDNPRETYDQENLDPCIQILINMALKNLPMETIKRKHSEID
eukprot:3069380-Ditylum_brightwellii.AAC.1